MASGRAVQLRMHAVSQSQLVWMFAQEFDPEIIQTFIESGSFGVVKKIPPNPLADKIVSEIHANGGKLIVDEAKFRRMAEELQNGKPL